MLCEGAGLPAAHNHSCLLTICSLLTSCAAPCCPRTGLESLTEGAGLPERERRFLGCLRVPLAAVYQAEVLAGAFKVGRLGGRALCRGCSEAAR